LRLELTGFNKDGITKLQENQNKKSQRRENPLAQFPESRRLSSSEIQDRNYGKPNQPRIYLGFDNNQVK
jgi:hypothetical protein